MKLGVDLGTRDECQDSGSTVPFITRSRTVGDLNNSQRSNFFDIPTDCPQRDERLGWTGDAEVYAGAATYHADTAAFYTKWLDDLDEAQRPNGAFPDYASYPMQHGDGYA